ncbi:MAG: ribonucleotide reductase N-terminal alpha domain-containing protein [Actinomycetota bacterium]|nr:ribonucleotide reductase N-terminal alpha domain-containing protein [Actinomycetota bacterium]
MEMENEKKIKEKKSEKNIDDYYLNKKINLSDNAIKVLERRYLKRDEEGNLLESPRDMFVRVAKNIASAEKKYGKTEKEIKEIEKQFFDIMTDLDFLPNSPTLMNAGKELQQLAACFVLPVGDSMNDIFEALKETALIQKSGGGVGYSFSNIRPKNDVVLSTKGVSSGPISFMTVFNAATDTIKQGGTRRGANMGILRVDHPDILEFISSKENNDKLNNFNISVGVTEKFMKAVENDEEYEIINPRTKEVVDKYRAREVFNKIVEHAWENGDPGIIFLDRLNKDNPTPHLGQIESTNPCVSGDTLISTDSGFIKASHLHSRIKAGENIKILFDKRALEYKVAKEFNESNLSIFESSNINSWNRGVKEVYRLITCSGYELEVTPEHKILTTKGYKKLNELSEGDEVLIQPIGKFPLDKKIFNNGKVTKLNRFTNRKTLKLPEYWSCELGEVIGWLIGDGWLRDDRVGFTFGSKDKEVSSYFKKIIKDWYNYDVKEILRENGVIHLSYHSKGFIEFFKELGVKTCNSREKEVPESLFVAPKEAVTGFLRGIFSSDGNIDDTDGIIKISSSSQKLLKGIQVLLLGLGIKSNILTREYSFSKNFSYVNKEGESKSYKARNDNYYELFISGGVSKRRFQDEIGFLLERKNKLLNSFKFEKLSSKNHYNKFIDKVASIEYAGEKEVFDFNEPVSNSYIANGIVVRNCGEQPLLPYEACNLGSINLANMVKEEEGKKTVDFDKLRKIVHIAVRFLDDVIDVSKYPLEKISKMARGNRKIGLGVMGYADLLIILGIPYDSEEALELAGKVMSFIQDESKNASRELAKEKGPFPNIKGSIYDSPEGYEIRNATTTTIAPTGTLSIIADCSSGVEPLFAISFVKNVMDNDKLVEVNKYFKKIAIDEGFYSEELMEKIAEKGNLKDIDEVPSKYKRVFVTAHEISPTWHVRTQATFQKFVDNAVSKTVNFPNDATVKDVEKVYMLAYRLGCKGITIFRDGSRGSQVLQVEGKKKGEGVLTAEVSGKKTESKKLKGGEKEEEIRKKSSQEIKEGSTEKVEEIRLKPRPRPEVTYGMTKKYKIGNCGKLYVTVNSDENGICEVFINTGEEGCAALTEALGRLISIAIRSGIDIKSVINQVEGIRCVTCIADPETYVLSCPDAMAKAIEYYLNGSNKFDLSRTSGPRSVVICPEEGCGGIMEPEGGCYVCRNCGFSKCS